MLTMPARPSRVVPLRYDDGFRAAITMLVSTPLPFAVLLIAVLQRGLEGATALPYAFAAICFMYSGFSVMYLIWTHRAFTRTDPGTVNRIAAIQHRRGPSRLARTLGFARAEDWAVFAASTALIISIGATTVSAGTRGIWLPALVLVTAATAWATMVYAFALRYFRLHAGGEEIVFDIRETPEFIDFVSMSVMVSSVGALSAGSPRTRAGLAVVRTHTFIAFAFNALVVAMIVSLVSGLVTAG